MTSLFRVLDFRQDLSYKEKHWHEACFLCNKCRSSLVDKQFGSKADRIYCGACYDAQFATRCDGCGDVFRAGELLFAVSIVSLIHVNNFFLYSHISQVFASFLSI